MRVVVNGGRLGDKNYIEDYSEDKITTTTNQDSTQEKKKENATE